MTSFHQPLIVCIGNICRSPIAEAIFKAHFEKYYPECTVASAGMAALTGNAADPLSVKISQVHGYDLSAHRAMQLEEHHLFQHDLILVMELFQQKQLETNFPFARGKIHRLGKFREKDIPDPYLKPVYAFEQMFKSVYDCSLDWLNQFWPSPQK